MDNKNFITNELNTAESVVITCCECNEEFTVSPEEQAWYKEKNYDLPRRCPACRKMRRKLKGAYKNGVKRAIRNMVSSVMRNGGAD